MLVNRKKLAVSHNSGPSRPHSHGDRIWERDKQQKIPRVLIASGSSGKKIPDSLEALLS